jgi:hypothetical protein
MNKTAFTVLELSFILLLTSLQVLLHNELRFVLLLELSKGNNVIH